MAPSLTRKILRWTGRVAGFVAGLIVLGAAGVYAMSEHRIGARFDVPDHPVAVADDSATIERGRYLTTVRGCVDCHGATLTGNVMVDDPAIGRLVGPNLTRGRAGGELDARDYERAIRHGVRRDGSPLRVMPAQEFSHYSDEDVGAMIAYIRSLPATSDSLPAPRVGPLARVLYLAGQIELLPAERIDHAAAHPTAVVAEPTVEYGKYITIGCTGCHGPGLSGGKIPGGPPEWGPAANITPTGIVRWSEAGFALETIA